MNLIFVGWAWLDQSWGAVWIALFLVPGINGFFALGALLYMYPASQLPKFSPWNYLLTYIGLPLAAIALVWLAISMMPLHGC